MARTVHCNVCFTIMKKLGDEWVCPQCGNSAYLEDPYDFDTLYFRLSPDDDYLEYFDGSNEDAIPEGCRACGGDYPNCCSSCNLMSD